MLSATTTTHAHARRRGGSFSAAWAPEMGNKTSVTRHQARSVRCGLVAATKGKPAWRAALLAARAAVPSSVRLAEAAALASWVGTLSGTVCAYHPVGTEPGSTLMLDALVAAGCRVLLPVVAAPGAALDWAAHTGGGGAGGGLAAGPYGLLEPVGPRLGRIAVASADTVLVPALAVDRRGVRLGRGGGYYDRTLVLAARSARLVAVVRDCEVVPELPADPHDVPMTTALTPSSGFTPLGPPGPLSPPGPPGPLGVTAR